MTLKNYFESALNIFLSEEKFYSEILQIAGRSLRINFSSKGLSEQFMPSIQHLCYNNTEKVEFTIFVGDENSLKKKLKAPPWSYKNFNAHGYASKIQQDEYQIFYQPGFWHVYLFSQKQKTGIYWVKSEKEIPWWEKTFSFRILFHWWTQNLPAQLMHAGAISYGNNNGFLITGPSGSGKSTTCLNLVKNGCKYLGDDYIWLEQGEKDKIIALYQTAKLEADNYQKRFKDWKPYLKNPTTFEQEKAIFDLKEIYPESWLSEAPLCGILLPRVKGEKGSMIKKTKKQLSLLAIAPTTLHHLPHHRKISYQKILSIVSKTITYSWDLSIEENENSSEFWKFIKNEINKN